MLWDEILELKASAFGRVATDRIASRTPCFEVTNVADWIVADKRNRIKLDGKLTTHPPNDEWFMEYRGSNGATIGHVVSLYPIGESLSYVLYGENNERLGSERGILVLNEYEGFKDMDLAIHEEGMKIIANGRFGTKELIKKFSCAYYASTFIKSSDGKIFDGPKFVCDFGMNHFRLCYEMKIIDEEKMGGHAEFTMLLFVSFMVLVNTKNMVLQTFRPGSTPEQAKKRAKKGKRPLVEYKTLAIDSGRVTRSGPMARMTAMNDRNLKLHFMRGHLKTYTEDAPLLGRHVGTWYWSPMMRGNRKRGEVVKDYEVKP